MPGYGKRESLSSSWVGWDVSCFPITFRAGECSTSSALDDPIHAIGGDGIIYSPKEDRAMTRQQLEDAKPDELIAYYAPIFIQQRVDSNGQPFPYPREYDEIGEASLRRDENGKYQAVISGQPRLYTLFQRREIDASDHVQLTYTAWYPAHPRMKTIDLEDASIDSCVVRITLDSTNVPLFYETIAAGGFYHKIFIPRWLENSARVQFGAPESGKLYSIERTASGKIDWEVAGLVEELRDQPRRPVFFIRSGDHKVIGMGNRSRLKLPPTAELRKYELTEYTELFNVRVEGTTEKKPFFDINDGSKVYGAERKERYLFSLLGVDMPGQPRRLRSNQDALRPERLGRHDRLFPVLAAPTCGPAATRRRKTACQSERIHEMTVTGRKTSASEAEEWSSLLHARRRTAHCRRRYAGIPDSERGHPDR